MKQKPIDINTAVYGRVPPQAPELEGAILGAIMLERNAFEIVIEIINTECFYKESHQHVFTAMKQLNQRSASIDMMTVTEQLKKDGISEDVVRAFDVVELTKSVVSAANIETHCRIVLEKFMKRELIRMSSDTLANAYNDSSDVFDLINTHEKEFTRLTTGTVKNPVMQIDTLLVKSVQRIEDLRTKDDHMTGVTSGFEDIDRVTHGWQDTDLIILAARPSVGKTALALNLARHAAMTRNKIPVAVFSMEMSSRQLMDRLMSAESEIFLEKISNGNLNDAEMKVLYDKAIGPLSRAKLYIDDTPAINIFELRAKCRRLKRKYGVRLIIIDYLQLMSGTNEKGIREQEISKISRDLKGLAKELTIPIIALSQLSRKPEERKGADKTPQLSDLRESGAIEQDADLVMFMYRPEYYDNANEMGESTKGETHIVIAKHRNGNLAKGYSVIKLIADLAIQKFKTAERDLFSIPVTALPAGNWKAVNVPWNEKNEL